MSPCSRRPSLAALALAAAACLSLAGSRASALPPCPPNPNWQAANGNNAQAAWLLGPKWMANPTVKFNETLDALLEQVDMNLNPLGDANSRKAGFEKAVDEWNCALAFVQAGIQITYMNDATKWAADWGAFQCVDQNHMRNVYKWDFDTNHHPDDTNAGSTGHNHANLMDINQVRLGDGWLRDPEQPSIDFEAIARCRYSPDNLNPMKMKEADICWFTHEGGVCVELPWDYRNPPNGPDAATHDWYSVMLHELGHFLGLDHTPDDNNRNVMQAGNAPGQRYSIRQQELDALCKLYLGGGACAVPVAAQPTTWGNVRATYR